MSGPRVRPARWDQLEVVQVNDGQIKERFDQWVEQAQQRGGEPVITYFDGPRSPWPLKMGIVRQVIDDGVKASPLGGLALTEASYVAAEPSQVRNFEHPIRIGAEQVIASFQRTRIWVTDKKGSPPFELVFGNEAIAQWFTGNPRTWFGSRLHLYATNG
jgi:hypothetical protein